LESVVPLGTSVVTGRILDSSGRPDGRGYALRLEPLSLGRGVSRAEFLATSDENGGFRFQGLASGISYRLEVSLHQAVLSSTTVRADGSPFDLRLPAFSGVEILPLNRLDGSIVRDLRAECWVGGVPAFIGSWDGSRLPIEGLPTTGLDGILLVGSSMEARVLGPSEIAASPLEVLLDPGREAVVSLDGRGIPLMEVNAVLRADLPVGDLRQHLVIWDPESASAIVSGAPLGSFTLQALDASGAPLGSPVTVPAQ